MPRYIDAELLSREIENLYLDGDNACNFHANADGDTLIGKMQVLCSISDAPTADVQEVIHCKDCIYCQPCLSIREGVEYRCSLHSVFIVDGNEFCSWAERRAIVYDVQ